MDQSFWFCFNWCCWLLYRSSNSIDGHLRTGRTLRSLSGPFLKEVGYGRNSLFLSLCLSIISPWTSPTITLVALTLGRHLRGRIWVIKALTRTRRRRTISSPRCLSAIPIIGPTAAVVRIAILGVTEHAWCCRWTLIRTTLWVHLAQRNAILAVG